MLGEAHPATQQATRALAATREAAASWSELWPTELQSLWPSIRAFGDLAGLRMVPGARGWRELRIAPRVWAPAAPGGGASICGVLPGVAATLATVRGAAASSWACGGRAGSAACAFSLNATVPVGSVGAVVLPTLGRPPAAVEILEGGDAVWEAGLFVGYGIEGVEGAVGVLTGDDGGPAVAVEVGSGRFSFCVISDDKQPPPISAMSA